MKKKGTYPWRATAYGVGIATVGYLVQRLPVDLLNTVGWWIFAAGLAWVAVRVGWYLRQYRSSQNMVARLSRRTAKTSGLAAAGDHWRFTSKRAMRQLGPVVRPTTFGDVKPRKIPVEQVATELARIGGVRVPGSRRVILGRPVYSSVEHHTLTIGPSGSGKSGCLACRIADAPGAVVAVSTTGDLYENTVGLRAARGPIYVMNLGGVAGIPNNLKWSVLVGCKDPEVADERAKDMIPTTGLDRGQAANWKELAQDTLGMLMHAAACQDRTMRAVFRWITNPDDLAYEEVFKALEGSSESVAMRQKAQQFFRNHKPTRDGIVTAMMPALRWLRSPRTAALGDAATEDLFDIVSVVEQGGTVYLIGEEKHTTAGLVTALISEIMRASRDHAIRNKRRQRLDPGLTFCLDEAALVCWVPLHDWTAELRARGITIHIAIQARSQLRARWGDSATGTIFTNCAAVMVYGGCKDPDDLAAYAKMAGYRLEEGETKDADGKVLNRQPRRVPVLEPGEIASLEGGTALVFRRDMRPFLARPQMIWERRDYLAALRAGVTWEPVPETSFEAQYKAEQAKEAEDRG